MQPRQREQHEHMAARRTASRRPMFRALLALSKPRHLASCLFSAFATMPQRLATRLLLLAVGFADEADDTRAAAAADHLRAGELKELLTKAGVEFG